MLEALTEAVQAAPLIDDVDSLDWHAIFLPGKTERTYLRHMNEAGSICFLPLSTIDRKTKDGRRIRDTEIRYPNYCFVFGDRTSAFFTSIRPIQVFPVCFYDRPCIAELMAKQRIAPLIRPCPLQPGVTVRICDGAYVNFTGRVVDLSQPWSVGVYLEHDGLGFDIPKEGLLGRGVQQFERGSVEVVDYDKATVAGEQLRSQAPQRAARLREAVNAR